MLSQKRLEYYVKLFNNQPGRLNPCSNQVVTGAIITHDSEKAIQVMNEKNAIIKKVSYNYIEWELNNERWIWRHWNENHRGYRFYKVIVDPNISEDLFRYVVVKSSFYCCSMEVMDDKVEI